ncbi:hypothetical protein PR048_000985 [Dryococelus australis]|uniref:CCHC-type domain-containing protein n=1 Tax=Dryococelus australis TaxID=614101 RepID=A0ABQ9IG84_9NEOP|nr:hypothetical protein PR048_000985 [Dryococelus australis]
MDDQKLGLLNEMLDDHTIPDLEDRITPMTIPDYTFSNLPQGLLQCAEIEHTATKCPLPRNKLKYQNCGKIGHFMKECKQKDKSLLQPTETDSENFVNSVTATVASSGVHRLTASTLNIDLSPHLGSHVYSLHDESLFLLSDYSSCLYIKPCYANSYDGPVLHHVPVGLRTWASRSLTIIGEFQAVVKYKHFTCNISVLVAYDIGPNLLGHNWFQALDTSIQGKYVLTPDPSYAGSSNETFSHTITYLPAASGHGMSDYKGPLLYIDTYPAVASVYQGAQSAAFALTTNIEEPTEANVRRGVWITVKHESPWASAIVPELKHDGTIRLVRITKAW